MSNRVAEIELDIQGEKITYPFHFGMSTFRQFAVKKGWGALSFNEILGKVMSPNSPFIEQTEFFSFALKVGMSYTQSKLPPVPESDIHENYYKIFKDGEDTVTAYLKDMAKGLGISEKSDEPGKG